jgi:hypothetical protein
LRAAEQHCDIAARWHTRARSWRGDWRPDFEWIVELERTLIAGRCLCHNRAAHMDGSDQRRTDRAGCLAGCMAATDALTRFR